ncbi:MAG: response regulator [Phenylobacterium sp.]|uniref:hybrid sensor histidine kinase/response regulator n=1 Tax=Phenylobacterium sp. TaxID=1871053 RepID=UPI00271FB13F|nr:hybrid sensor histidine kinase/response regulator [Phenylobacterium sp.]MDO8410499.1 response regulator [Phenylobacterium sp.]
MSPHQHATVLVVEDSETQALALRGRLEAEGYTVQTVTSAEAALERLNGPLPDLVVADFHLPGMDGREMSRQLRLNRRTRTLPLLMLTSAREQDLERQGLESGADAYVSKSADMDVMLARLRALLRRGRTAASEGASATDFRPARIIVAHDSPTQRLRLAAAMAQAGYEVREAANAEAALAAANDEIDCIVMPASGAGLDGLDLCRRLDRRRERMALPFQIVVIGPGASDPHALAAAFDAGADDVTASTDDDEVLRMRVRALVRRKLLAEETRRAEEADARAAAADELSRANAELEAANHQLRQAQAQLVQSAKMASLGELVAGIAHEINNPLAFILGHQNTVERLTSQVAGGALGEADKAALAKAADRLGAMRMGLQRIQSLVLNLRKFSRLDEAESQSLDVPDAIETVLALLAPKMGAIEVRRRLEARTTLTASPALLNQVVMNILSNAADALGGEGVIEIATSEQNALYRIEINDSGPGVPEAVRDRIFEPFFTTKPVGAGTGLGLAIAYAVVRAHKGEITVDSGPLGGARFVIQLPVDDQA